MTGKRYMNGRKYEVYCGNFDCPTRLAGNTFIVEEGIDLVDGELWLCENCRPPIVDVVESP
jgi:hypothetical protein